LEASADGEQQHDGQQQPGQHEEEEEEQGPKEAGGIVGGALGAAAQERLCEPGVSILESVHIDWDFPISRLFLSRNIEDGNARAGAVIGQLLEEEELDADTWGPVVCLMAQKAVQRVATRTEVRAARAPRQLVLMSGAYWSAVHAVP
jgi:hypothetical protein